MRKTQWPALSLSSLSLPSPASSSSSSRSSLLSRQSGYLRRHMSMIFLLVVLALPPSLMDHVQAVQNSAMDEAGVQKRSNDEHGRRDVRADSLSRNPGVRNSEVVDNQHFPPGVRDTNIPIKQAALQKEAAVFPDKSRDVPLSHKLQKLQGQANELRRNEEIEDRERKIIIRQKMEERDRVLNEQMRQQELKQQQARYRQQNILETQKEQQREQLWLKEVHRKSQEALAERHNKQQQDSQAAPAINPALEVHDKQEQAPHEGHADLDPRPNLPQKNNSSDIGNRLNYYNNIMNNSINGNNNNKADTILGENQSNSSSQRKLPDPGIYVLAGEARNSQSQLNHNQEIKPPSAEEEKPVGSSNRNLINELQKKVDASSIGNLGDQIPNKEGNGSSPNSEQGVPVAVIPQDTNPNFGVQNEQNGNPNIGVQSEQNGNPNVGVQNEQNGNPNIGVQNEQNGNPSNVANNNNQWAKYEFNNAQQPQQQQQQQQQQQPQQQQQQQSQHQPQIGGINLSWDWEDFSVMFNSYGAAEMKVRRSPHPTTGEPWPLPQYYSKKDDKIYKVSKDLHFIPTGVKCDILEEALTRHVQRTLRGCVEDMYDNLQNAEGSPIEDPALRYEKDEFLKAPVISRVEVKVRKPCEKYPSLESDESYDLVIKKRKTYIWANEVWGALRGLETFGHLVWRGTDGFLYMKETVISDYPRFPHRGLHIDTSRHFLFKEVILDILDSMEMNKLNVFHWHIVDDQSFPYESKVYPELSRKGAFHPSYVYTLEDIAEIIEYARLRGIRVMPEFDTPGHTFAWGLSRPELLTQCYSGSVPVKGYLGPIDPSKNSTYRFLQTLFKEIMEVFKDQYLHLGGDEVPLGCWQSNPEVAAFAQELAKRPHDPQQSQGHYAANANFGGAWSMWSDDIRRVYEYYENRLITMLNEIGQKRKKGIKYVMWQEVMNNNLQLPNDTIIQVWMGDMADVMRATSMGYQVIYSTCWYMDHIEYGTKWPKYYNCDPVDQSFGFHIDEKKVLGGEAAFWAEYFSNENLIPLMWPRASAAAERLWSNKEVKNLDKAAERLAEHRCRMIKRGINAGEINGPGYCLHSPPKRRLFNDTAGCKGGNCSRTHNFVQIEDFEVHVSQRGGSLADCGNVFTQGNSNIFILLTLALIVVVALYALSKSSSQFHRMRIFKNRSILIVFVGVLLVYLLCYTTIWMRAFEFSGSFHKTLQEDKRSGFDGSSDDDSKNFRPISS